MKSATPRPEIDDAAASMARAGLVAAAVGSYLIWLAGVATMGVGDPGQLPIATLTTAAAVAALGFHLGVMALRGKLSALGQSSLFVLAFSMFHFGSFGILARGWYRPELLAGAWALCAASLAMWLLGHGLTCGPQRPELDAKATIFRHPARDDQLALALSLASALFFLGFGLQLVVFAAVGAREFFALDYMTSKQLLATSGGSRWTYLFAIGQLSANVGLVFASVCGALKDRRVFPSGLFIAVFVAYAVTLVLQGDRSQLAVILLPPLMCHHLWVRPIPLRRLVMFGALALMLSAGIKLFRGTKAVGDLVSQSTDRAAVAKILEESGTTLDTVIRSMTLVPEQEPYFMGQTYLEAGARALPNLTFSERSWGFVSSSWITERTEPKAAARKGGLGFSIVAEAYINFGLAGAPLLLLLLGMFHGVAERALHGPRPDVLRASAFLILEIALLVHVRNSAVLYVRGTIWMLTLLGLCAFIVAFFSREQRTARRA